MTKPRPEPKIVQLMRIMGYEFAEQPLKKQLMGHLTDGKEKAKMRAAATAK